MSSSRKIAPLKIKRQAITQQSVNEIVSKNLFRKERSEYQPPNSPQPTSQAAKIPQKPELPAPKLTLRGVMLLGGTKIAILEGSHAVTIEGEVENTPIKRKGYHLGDKIGDYKISKISKREVMLDNLAGQIITIKLQRRMSSAEKISKPKQKSLPRQDQISKPEELKSNTTSMQPVIKKRPQPTPHISGSIVPPLQKKPIQNHISGRKHISGR